MNYGGDAADQIVRYSMEGMEHSLRLSGTLAKNLAVFFMAVLKDQKKTYGKTRMVRMLKENRPLKFFTVPSDRLKEFAKEGKKRGLLYVVIKDKKNPSQCEIMVFADDAAKVNRVMDRMNLDFLRSESGEAVHEVEQEAEHTAGAQTESVELPEGEVEFELGDLETDFGFGDDAAEPGNFTQAQEERNPSGPSSRSSGTFTGQESPDAPEKPSVREELAKIKKEKQDAGKEKARTKNRSRNRAAGRKKKKSKVKAKMKLKGR
jgi:hypothetical protein